MVLNWSKTKQQPDEKLFEEIYRKHFKKVLFFAHKYVNDNEKAENIAQDVFLALWGQMEILDENGDILPFLFVLTKYRCLNLLRREKYHEKYTKSMITDYDISITALSDVSSTNLYYSDLESMVQTAIEKMPQKVRETFIFSRFKNLKNKEIAGLQNISEKTVEYRMSCAFKVLRKIFKNYVYLGFLYLNFVLFSN